MDDIIPSRKQTLLQGVNIDTYGLEIGPSFRPIAPKKEGYKVKVIDHASAKELRKNTVNMELMYQKLKKLIIYGTEKTLKT
jgi:hypothetical protein